MPNSPWLTALQGSPDPVRAEHGARRLGDVIGTSFFTDLSPARAKVVANLLAASKACTELLLAHPELIVLTEPEALEHPRQRQGLLRDLEVIRKTHPGAPIPAVRAFKQREMLRIAARDLGGFADLTGIVTEISDVADTCMACVVDYLFKQLSTRYGTPYTQDPTTRRWRPSRHAVLGMGKLGGQELNYSSDIDILFVYSGEGFTAKTPPKTSGSQKGMSNTAFFNKLVEALIAECTRMTPEGFLFRLDLRLRPEGKSSPLARSLSSYENYYAQWGQTWERMMLIKARGIAGDPALAAEFLEMIQPFRYPRSISEQIPQEVAEIKARIESEVVRSGELERNVKLGRGGIREIEFIVQTLQVLHGGRNPFLQGAQTLPMLEKLADYQLLGRDEARALKDAYCFLRNIEHRLQMEDNQQTHTIPVNVEARERLARSMGCKSLPQFDRQLQSHNRQVRTVYQKVMMPENSPASPLPPDVPSSAKEWIRILQEHSFRDPERSLKLLQEFINGPDFGHRSNRTVQNALRLMQALLSLCPGKSEAAVPFLSDPDRVLARLDMFVARYGARTMLYEAWVSNPSLFRLLLLAFDRSEYLAELAIREPGLIDEIEQSGHLRRRKSAGQILADLRHGSGDADQFRWLRRYYQGEQMRIALRDILDLATPEQTQDELTALADGFLNYTLEIVMKQNRLRRAPLAIVGLGKLGGRELIYASDLDVVFVASDAAKNLPALQKIAVQVLDLLSKRTEDGRSFAADARLRPDGDKGLLVNTLRSYSDYYCKRALIWEIQSLTRFRPIAGDGTTLRAFSALARSVTDFRAAGRQTSAYQPGWKKEIHRMRLRIEKERTPAGKNALAIKTGTGGLMDVEFVAQALALEHGWHEPSTLAAIDRSAAERVLPAAAAKHLGANYRKLMEIERILRRWSFEPESVLPDDPAPFYRVAIRCGFKTAEEFRQAVAEIRAKIRKEYLAYFERE